MLGKRHEIAWLQSGFYREKFRKVLRWLTVSVFIMFFLIGAIIYVVLFQPTVHYYANTIDGKIMDMPQPRT
ncbi:hypothetical protein AQUSIP_20120 [Aquicella siphonis]|uniref:Uncharacterized protein n=1 Tax=Aquicella siphonis TaxID=254247 RepID=A0A5E4PJQ1_9COXI|nr:hypothetical protein [Aquicella siphonis]VVC76688.1 hypothetical protein AQUSIP_20120 [Aquicella siphonis]